MNIRCLRCTYVLDGLDAQAVCPDEGPLLVGSRSSCPSSTSPWRSGTGSPVFILGASFAGWVVSLLTRSRVPSRVIVRLDDASEQIRETSG